MATMVAKGATQREIAETFGLSQPTVNRDVALIRRRWQKEAVAKIDHWKGILLAGHTEVIREAWSEFERSKADAQSIVEVTELMEALSTPAEQAAIAKGESVQPRLMELTKRSVSTEGQTGDPRYLTVIINAQAEQAKILGAHAPAKLQHAGVDGGPMAVQFIEVIPPAESNGEAH